MLKSKNIMKIMLGCSLCAAVMSAGYLHAQSTPDATWQAKANDQWRPVDQSDLRVEKGSALDFSALVESGPAGKHGYVVANANGQLAFADQPEKSVRFLCFSENMTHFRLSKQEDIDSYADEIVRAGYNMYRPHFLDTMLMRRSQTDLEFNPDTLDVWDRLSAALKKRGVYLYFDATTSWLFFSHINPWHQDAATVPPHSVMLYWNEASREHWKTGVAKILTHVNPYTNIALKDEPQVVILQLRNESGLGFKTYFSRGKKNQADLVVVDQFKHWLKNKYKTSEAMQKAWNPDNPSAEKRTFETLDMMPELYAVGPDTADLYQFFTDSERAVLKWERDVVRELGVKSLVLDFNNMHNVYSHLVRDMLDVSDGHVYHSHPTKFDDAGSKIDPRSLTETYGAELVALFSSHHLGRPMICSEWGVSFWHPWRGAEAGMTMASYASLQGLGVLTQHAQPFALVPLRAGPFNISTDPANKAAERMAALLYLRNDVRQSPHVIQANIHAQSVFQNKPAPAYSLPETLTRLSLLSGFGIQVTGLGDSAPRAKWKADIEFTPSVGGKLFTQMGAQSVEIEPSTQTQNIVEKEVEGLRQAGILSASNRTNVSKGIYESDTGEILLNSAAKQIQVNTPRSQGASLHVGAAEIALPQIKARTSGETMGVFLSSLDSKPLAGSKRMLLIVATDALNSGMTFENDERITLIKRGDLPVLVKTAKLDLTISNDHSDSLEMWALNLRGRRMNQISLQRQLTGQISATIDTAVMSDEPAFYYELVVKP